MSMLWLDEEPSEIDDPEAAVFEERAMEPQTPADPPAAVTSAQLAAADEAATAGSVTAAPGGTVSACGKKLLAIAVTVVGEDDAPIEDVALELRKSENEVLATKSGADGVARFEGIDAGSYELACPELDQDAWEIAGTTPLDTDGKVPPAAWKPPAAAPAAAPLTHTTGEGECISTLALRFGFAPATIWDDSANASLKELRKEKNILATGDEVTIPVRRVVAQPVEGGQSVRILRKGVPDVIRIRFLGADGAPRKELPYLIELEDDDGKEQRSGTTNGEGFVIQKASPSIRRVTIILGPQREEYVFRAADLDPLETISGVQDRLRNLGYGCGDEDGTLGPLTRRALRDFQRDSGLPESGTNDQDTLDELKKQHLC